MELNQLRGFYALAREHSFSKAASRLALTQPAISMQIKALEEELGEPLFERHRKGVRLTTAGEVLYDTCNPCSRAWRRQSRKSPG